MSTPKRVNEKASSKSYNEQQNLSEFAEEETTVHPAKAKDYPASLNNINKNVT
jgi:hypothetical protein